MNEPKYHNNNILDLINESMADMLSKPMLTLLELQNIQSKGDIKKVLIGVGNKIENLYNLYQFVLHDICHTLESDDSRAHSMFHRFNDKYIFGLGKRNGEYTYILNEISEMEATMLGERMKQHRN